MQIKSCRKKCDLYATDIDRYEADIDRMYEKCVKAAHRRHVGKKLHVVMKRVLYALHLA